VGKGSLIANEYPALTSQIKETLLSDLNERKIVKTISLKKVSAVAVASLGFGLLSVVPAQAAGGATVFESVGTNTTTTGSAAAPIPAGTAATFDLMIKSTAGTTVAAETVGAKFTVTAGPASLDITSTCTFTSVNVADGVGVGDGDITSSVQAAATGEFRIVVGAAGAAAVANAKIGTASCPTTIGGEYKVTITGSTLTTAAGTTFGTPTAPTTVATGLVIVSGLNVSQGTTRSTTAGTAQNGGNANVIWTLPIRAAATDVFQVIPSGVGSVQTVASLANATVTPISGVSGNFLSGARVVSTADDTATLTSVNITATSVAAGVLTLTTQSISSTTGVVTTIGTATITFGAAPVVTASTSKAFLSAGTDFAAADDAGGVTLASTAGVGAAQATIAVTINDQNGTAINGQALAITVAGPGLIIAVSGNGATGTGNVRATSRSATDQANTNLAHIGITADGTSGVSTITITSGTTVIATKTVTFYGAVKTLTAKQNHVIASSTAALLGTGVTTPAATSIATTPAVVITAKDANGVAVPNLTITAKSSDLTVMSETIEQAGDSVTTGNYNIGVNSVTNTSGKTATLTFRVMSGTTVLAESAAVPYTLGGAVATVALSLDKSAYGQGSAAVATLTVKDSVGNKAFDGDHTTVITGALATSMSIVKTLQFNATTATTVSSLNGVSTVSFNAPASATAVWTISGTAGAGASVDAGKALSATASVTDATAAIQTSIASLNAKIVALNALIAKIMKRLNIR
jgi:hypothetical protein